MQELVRYGIRLLAKQFLGTVLDIEVDQSDLVVPVEAVSTSMLIVTQESLAGTHMCCPVL